MKFRKRPVEVEAVQWFKNGDHPAVEERKAHILFSRDGAYYYVTHYEFGSGSDMPMASNWVAVDPNSPEAQKTGAILPFAFYEVKSGEKASLKAHPELVNRYVEIQGWPRWPTEDRGYIKTLEGGHLVTPGDWIITGVKGEFYPCKPDIFKATYEPVHD
jgi:hypothetical protein